MHPRVKLALQSRSCNELNPLDGFLEIYTVVLVTIYQKNRKETYYE